MSPYLHPFVRTRHLYRHLICALTPDLLWVPQQPSPAPSHLLPLPNTPNTAPQAVYSSGLAPWLKAFSSSFSTGLDVPVVSSSSETEISKSEQLATSCASATCLDVPVASSSTETEISKSEQLATSCASATGLNVPAASSSAETEISKSEQFFKGIMRGVETFSVERNRGSFSSVVEKALSSSYSDPADHATERALITKIRSLNQLEFTKPEILNAVRKLSGKVTDMVTFVHLPCARLNSVQLFFSRLGISRPQSRRLLERAPSIFLRDQEHLETTCRVWERILGRRTSVIRSIKYWPEILLVRKPDLEEASKYLQSKVEDKETLRILLENNPKVLCSSKEDIECAVKFLSELGMEEKKVVHIISAHPFLLEGPQVVRAVEFLKSKGLQDHVICRVLFGCAAVLHTRDRGSLHKKFRFLEKHGFTGEELNTFLSGRPTLLKYSVSKIIAQNKELLMRLGVQDGSPLMRMALRKSFGRNLEGRIRVLTDFGIEYGTASKLFMDFPFMISLSRADLQKKADFLFNTMHKSVEEIFTSPFFFSCGLESKIKPRFRVISWLRSIGELQEDVPLSTYVSVSNEDFFEQFVNRHPEGPAIYEGKVQTEAKAEVECAES